MTSSSMTSALRRCPPTAIGAGTHRPRGRSRRSLSRAHASSSSVPSSSSKSILGLGSCGIDYLAQLDGDDFPRPDGKYRASSLVVCGGGNVSNGLTAAARLGASCALVSKLGRDANGRNALAELETDGVRCEGVFVDGERSPFTYVLIAKNKEGDDGEKVTRTCVHTPGDGLSRDELTNGVADGLVEKFKPDLAYFDGRLTEAAIELARAAKRKNVKILVEAERLRENLGELLTHADVVMTSKTYPGEAEPNAKTLGDAMTRVFARLPNARVMVTTLGARGAVALVREDSTTVGEAQVLDEVIERLELSVDSDGVAEIPGESASSGVITVTDASGDGRVENVRVIFAPAMKLREDEVVDTTGCGDAFIGAFAYAACEDDFDVGETMRLCSYVAAKKCRDVGARRGLPRADEIPSALRRQTSTRRSALFSCLAGFAAAAFVTSPDTRAEAAAADVKTLTELFNRAMTSPSYEEAVSLWTKAIEIAPPNSPALSAAYSNRGTLRLQYSEWLGAVEDLQKSVDLDGDHPDPLALNNLGNSKGALGRWDEAMADFLEASRFEDMRAIAQANYALAAFQTGRQDLATSTARKLLRRDPEFLDMRAALSAFLWAAGDQAEAEAEWTYLCKSGRGFGAKESAESKRDEGALAYSATLLSQQFAQIGAELTGGVKEAGLDTPCRLYKTTDVVANRWPPRATAALDAFLRVRRDGQALDYDGEVKTFDFPIASHQ